MFFVPFTKAGRNQRLSLSYRLIGNNGVKHKVCDTLRKWWQKKVPRHDSHKSFSIDVHIVIKAHEKKSPNH